MIFRLICYIRGYICIRVRGGFTERFINLCNEYSVSIWNIAYVKGDMYACARPCDYRKIKKLASRSGMKIKIVKRCGLPFVINRNKNRCFLAGGIIITVATLMLMSQRIWTIRVTGNNSVFSSEILQTAEKYGISEGKRKKAINTDEAERLILEDMKDKLHWVSVNIDGMYAEIEVKEITESEDDETGIPCNMIASFDGVITKYNIFRGTAVNIKGNAVKKGDLLISSVIEYTDGSSAFVEAMGDIEAKHRVKIKTEFKTDTLFRKYIKTKTVYSLSVFGLEIPLGFVLKDGQYEKTLIKNQANINGVGLPFSFNKYVCAYYEEAETENARQAAMLSYLNSAEKRLKNAYVISLTNECNELGDKIVYTGTVKCIEKVGEKAFITIEKS